MVLKSKFRAFLIPIRSQKWPKSCTIKLEINKRPYWFKKKPKGKDIFERETTVTTKTVAVFSNPKAALKAFRKEFPNKFIKVTEVLKC